jgi:uncharacterized protein
MTDLPAGNFSAWLRAIRGALAGGAGMQVACGDCVGCCTSSYFIKVRSHEKDALAAIDERGVSLEPAPGNRGDMLMGYDEHGHCPMFANGGCSIYPRRPDTCRTYDCRVFAAAGLPAGGDDKSVINARVARWRFDYPTPEDRDEQRAVRAAAAYLRQHPVRFPNGRVPSRAAEIAVLAIKSYPVFMNLPASDTEIKAAIVATTREFGK